MKSSKDLTFSKIMAQRLTVFGVAAIWILLFHLQNSLGPIKLPRVPAIINMGNMGVDIFLFLSAIGLCHSMKKNSIKTYYFNRLKRVILPYVIVTVPFFIWFDFFLEKDGILEFLLNVTTLNFWIKGDHPVWYVAFIIVMYGVFPLIYKMFVKNKYIAFAILVSCFVAFEVVLFMGNSIFYINAERALSRVPIFMAGVLFGFLPEMKISKICIWISFAVSVMFIIIYPVASVDVPIFIKRYFYGVIGVAFTIAFSYLMSLDALRWMNKALSWFGLISFEIYIIHVYIIRLLTNLNTWSIMSASLWWPIIIMVTLLLSVSLKFLTDKINEKIVR